MSYRLGADGYAFSKIDPVPTPDNDKKTVSLTFFIEPGNRVYVRHINFNNTTAINDETLRREMRQLEGGWLSNSAIERSKERMQRLPYVEKVEFETKPVPGSADLVDVDYNIKEGLPGQFGGGIGYSEAQKFSLNGNFVHSNFMGTGDRVALEVNAGKYSKTYTFAQHQSVHDHRRRRAHHLAHLPRHHAVRGGRIEVLHQAVDRWRRASPIRSPSTSTCQIGVSANKNELVVSQGYSSQQAIDWVQHNGNTFTRYLDDTNGDNIINSLDSPVYRLRSGFLYLRADAAAGISIPATARCSPTAACIWRSRRATRCRSATCATTPPTSSSCSTSRCGASGCCPTTRASTTPSRSARPRSCRRI